MNITEFAIKKSRITISILLAIIVAGLFIFGNLAQNSMPPYTVRVANVVAEFPGAGPERVENLVTDKIEKRIQEVPEVKEINSQSRTGLSVISVTLKDEVPPRKLQAVWDLIRRKINAIQQELPSGTRWKLEDDGIGEVYGISVGLVSDGISYDEMKDYADDIRDVLIKLEEAAKVEIGGAQEEQVFIKFDNAQLAKYGLSAGQLQNIISGTNILYSGGEVNQETERIILEPTGNFDEIDDLNKTIVPTANRNEVIYLGDITRIHKGYASPQEAMVRVNGKQAISLAISLKKGANIVKLGEIIDHKIVELSENLPIGLDLVRLTSMDTFVDGEVNNFISNLLQSVCIVFLVMLIFLGLRTGIVIASLIPVVTLATLAYMGIINMGLNQVTLAGLIMALGMMVDNAVVVSESIMVKMEEGMSRLEAAIASSKELFIPLLISTLTTSAAFLSFFLAESIMGDIVGPLFVVISSALIFSWLLSLTMVAMFSYYFIKIGKRNYSGITGMIERPFDWLATKFDVLIQFLRNYYEKLINWGLRFRYLVIISIFSLFVLSLFGFNYIPFIFMPDSERNLITVDINLPLGTQIGYNEKIIFQIEDFIQQELLVNDNRKKGIKSWSSFIGEGPRSYDLGYQPDEPNSGYTHMLVNTSSGDDNGYVIARLDSFAFNSFPDADIKVKRLGSGGGGVPLEILISGDNPNILRALAEKVKRQLKDTPGTKNVVDDWGPKTKKLVIDIDQNKAQRAGLTNQDIAISLQTGLTGFQTGDFREGEDNLPIIMQNEKGENLSVDKLESVNIYAQGSGTNVPLIQVAEIKPEWQFAQIRRKDLFRTIRVKGELQEGANASAILGSITPWLDDFSSSWQRGYRYELGGDDKSTAENMGAVADWLPMSGFIILMLLIIQFNSFRKTFMVLMTIPLAIIGVVIGLISLNTYMGFFAFLGTISLAGIVINNAIVLIDRIEIELNNGLEGSAAIVEAGRQRFRPILLTTFTTILGLIPLYMGGGVMWEPLAASIMIGLLFGTIITLVFIPVMYSLLYRMK